MFADNAASAAAVEVGGDDMQIGFLKSGNTLSKELGSLEDIVLAPFLPAATAAVDPAIPVPTIRTSTSATTGTDFLNSIIVVSPLMDSLSNNPVPTQAHETTYVG